MTPNAPAPAPTVDVDVLVVKLTEMAGEQAYVASDFESMQSDAGRRSAKLCESRANVLFDAIALITRLRADGERLDWLEEEAASAVVISGSAAEHFYIGTQGIGTTVKHPTLRDAIDDARGAP